MFSDFIDDNSKSLMNLYFINKRQINITRIES